jgi:hypothetical protein
MDRLTEPPSRPGGPVVDIATDPFVNPPAAGAAEWPGGRSLACEFWAGASCPPGSASAPITNRNPSS